VIDGDRAEGRLTVAAATLMIVAGVIVAGGMRIARLRDTVALLIGR